MQIKALNWQFLLHRSCILTVAFAAKLIIQSPVTSCSRRIIQYARQAQIVFWKFPYLCDAA